MKSEKASETTEKKKPPFDLLDFLYMRPRKIDKKYKKYASFNRRMLAATIDSVIAMFVIAPATYPILNIFIQSRNVTMDEVNKIASYDTAMDRVTELARLLIESGRLSEIIVHTSILIIASALCWKKWSATPGKMLLRMKIVDAVTEQPMTGRQIIIRSIGYIPSCAVFALGIIWISFNKRRQGWHDLMAGTVVIVESKKKDKITEKIAEKTIETAASVS